MDHMEDFLEGRRMLVSGCRELENVLIPDSVHHIDSRNLLPDPDSRG